ncbi:predicted protein [Naegleria gruberi]|uniref:Predicted protein n=1 Tax=Naegleria gruberi TaxID=5762 RepID=D2VWV2_NAEGR|nr:uncharacterized protein NAEGRDRAFT_59438 [Naegleria gruberi]EFC38689.1 predicted protein [Naegleria gruberi]|eukprot:XP_002671433.1 predicted protein [Naegleria gruberi strain NEG-M]
MLIQNNNNIQQASTRKREKVLILGPSDSGKSTLFHMLKLITSGHDVDAKFENNLRIVSSWVIERIWEAMGEQERNHLKDLIPELRSVFENTEDANLATELQNRDDCCEILVTLWKIPFFREFYESVWSRDGISMFENVKELVSRIEHKKSFSPYSLVHCRTTGILSYETMGKNTEIEVIDVGGRRNERKKWIHCFEDTHTLIYMVSLSEFNQTLIEDNSTRRMDESLSLISEVMNSRWFVGLRKIILFVKPDILCKKLENGVKYGGELNPNILPELDRIADHYLKLVINSIITEFFKKIDRTTIDSYHIVNNTSEDDIKSVCEMIFGERSAQKTTFISPCIIPANNRMILCLFNICLQEKLTDIQIITSNEEENYY